MHSVLSLIGRSRFLFSDDIKYYKDILLDKVSKSSFLILGGAGSIGQAVTKEVFKRNPTKLHVVDINENNLAELVRDIRSSHGYMKGEFKTFAIDVGSAEYDAFIKSDGKYDYVLNLSALKHVRSEEDPYTLMRMIVVNIFNTDKTIKQSIDNGTKKYFCVSTDKAANPVNMMGASKFIMEKFLLRNSREIKISTARFANVAFSDGSLLYSFNQRFEKKQPIVAPKDVRRYFLSSEESGELCLMSCVFGNNMEIFFPKLDSSQHLINLSDIAMKYIKSRGYEPFICSSEDEARDLIKTLPDKRIWPCLFTVSDTTGEKEFEEFFTEEELLDMNRFKNIGVIQKSLDSDESGLTQFEEKMRYLQSNYSWSKQDLVDEFAKLIPNFNYFDEKKYLDGKM